ncbi:hypothetical protein ACSQ67_020027 [Phaseolus vulgaris]
MAVFWTKQPAPIPSATFIFIFFFFAPCDLAILHNLKVSPSEFIGSVRKVGDVLQNVTSTLKSEFNNVKSVFPLSDAIFACLELLDLSADELSWSISAVESPQGKHNSTGNLSSDLSTWLSAVLANTDTCMEGFDGTSESVKDLVSNEIKEVTWYLQKLVNQIVWDYFRRDKVPSWVEPLLQRKTMPADAVVAADGSGDFTRVMDAVNAAPEYSMRHFVIHIKKGLYTEKVEIKKNKWNLVMIGEGMDATVISGNLSRTENLTTFRTATFAVNGRGFIATDISFKNTAGPERNQAVALRSDSDLSCSVPELHNTGKKGLQGQKNTITAQGETCPSQSSGFSIQFSNISADYDLLPSVNSTSTYLGRPWKKYSRAVFMQSYMSEVLRPEGWLEWNGSLYLDTLYFGEYKNYGPGARVDKRVKWPGYHVINDSSQVYNFTVANLLLGDLWIPSTGVTYTPGFGV